MSIKNMHYDFKQKLNKIDSQQNRNLRIPEIDWKLNEALEQFIKNIAEPRVNNQYGFEVNQRVIDDIRPIVVNDKKLTAIVIDESSYYVELPINYMFFLSAKILISNTNCGDRFARAIVRQHDDRFEESVFDNSSYEWKEVNVKFYEKGIKIYTDKSFTIKELHLDYIKKHPYIHYAEGFLPAGTYNLPEGTVLTGFTDCLLAKHTHNEIVNIAVYLSSIDLNMADQQSKQIKTILN